jgi:DNA repair protein RecO (recombination protein O)
VSAPAETTPAVLLRTRALRESDLVIVMLTPIKGKLETIGRGARKSRRRFPGGLAVGARGEATVAQGRGSLMRLDGFSATTDHSGIGRDLTAFAYVNYVCELTDHLVVGQHGDPRLFAGLCQAIESILEAPKPTALRRFELTVLDCLGLLPTFGHCCVCGDSIEGQARVRYETGRGGALCQKHGRDADTLDAKVLQACQALLEGQPDALGGATLAQRKAVKDLIQAVVRRHLRKPLKSLEFFSQLPPATSTSEG